MTDPSPEVAVLVAGLTKAQREALLDAYDIGVAFITKFESFRSARVLHRKGLTQLHWSPSGLTPLGLQVRAALIAEQSL